MTSSREAETTPGGKDPPLDVFLAHKWKIPLQLAKFTLRWHFWIRPNLEKRRPKAKLSRYLVRYMKGKGKMTEATKRHLGSENPWLCLTERQREVAQLRLKGYRNDKISEMLQIETSTVRTHLRVICRITGTHSVREALATLRLFPHDV